MSTTTTTTTITTSQYVLGGAKYRSGSIMGLTQDDVDNVLDVIYSTKPDQGSVNTLNAMSTSITNIIYLTIFILIFDEISYENSSTNLFALNFLFK